MKTYLHSYLFVTRLVTQCRQPYKDQPSYITLFGNKIALVFLLVMFCSIGKAQNWELFPLNQLSYFSFNSDSQVSFLTCDSTINNTNQKYYYFNTKKAKCKDVNLRVNTNTLGYVSAFSDSAVFYFKRDVSYPIFFNDTSTHYFQVAPAIPKSSSRFIGVAIDTLFGDPDSIRIFEISVDGYIGHVIWSKRLGIIAFVNPAIDPGTIMSPFSSTLIGFESNGQKFGYKPQKSSLYFPYQSGDILFWESITANYMNSPATYSMKYIRDSIISKFSINDSIGYLANRSVYEFGQTTTFLFKQMIPVQLVDQPADDASIGKRYYGSNYVYFIWLLSPLVRNFSLSDSTETRTFITGFNSIDIDSCSILSTLSPYVVALRTGLGLISVQSGTYITYQDELKAWRIGSNHYGSIEFPVGIREIEDNSTIVFPNPAHEKLHYRGINSFGYEIKNVVGQIATHGFATSDTIDISELPDGVYFITIFSDKVSRPVKFIKN